MSGYTPLFQSIATGTLCGRWPDIGLWPIVLAIADRHGIVDVTPQYISGVTGLPIDDVIACMKRFCQPDPYSRTGVEGGARLVLIDEHRDWGWRVVNHSKYREKARLLAKDSQRTESGADAERKRASREVPRYPPESPAIPPSDSDSDSDSDKKKSKRSNGHEMVVPTDVDVVFNHWKQVHSHPRSQLDEKRRKVIRLALKIYTPELLCLAISGYKKSPFHMGKNDRKTVYDDIETLLRDAKHIDDGIKFADTKTQDDPRYAGSI